MDEKCTQETYNKKVLKFCHLLILLPCFQNRLIFTETDHKAIWDMLLPETHFVNQ